MSSTDLGKLIVVSGPSGAGKTTVLREVLRRAHNPLLHTSVSATTRPPRPGEIDGRDYHFLTAEEFARRREEDGFVECCEVYGGGEWYGTPKSEVSPSLQAGKWVILEIDVQGTMAVLEQFPDAVTIFVRPGSADELRRRLHRRGTEDQAKLRRRLEVAERELTFADRYRHQVINDDLETAVEQLLKILEPNQSIPNEETKRP